MSYISIPYVRWRTMAWFKQNIFILFIICAACSPGPDMPLLDDDLSKNNATSRHKQADSKKGDLEQGSATFDNSNVKVAKIQNPNEAKGSDEKEPTEEELADAEIAEEIGETSIDEQDKDAAGQDSKACFYSKKFFSGKEACRLIADDLPALGFEAKSVIIVGSLKVQLFKKKNFRGSSAIVRETTANLQTVNLGNAKSAKVTEVE